MWKTILESCPVSYFDGRAIELISTANKRINDPKRMVDLNTYRDYDDLICQAVRMLTLARAIRGSDLGRLSDNDNIVLTTTGLEQGQIREIKRPEHNTVDCTSQKDRMPDSIYQEFPVGTQSVDLSPGGGIPVSEIAARISQGLEAHVKRSGHPALDSGHGDDSPVHSVFP